MTDELYLRCTAEFGQALERLAAGYEANPAQREDLLQEIHSALWRSLRSFDGRCALRTWVYRVAHNTAVTHVRDAVRRNWVSLDEVDSLPVTADVDRALLVERLLTLIHKLRPLDRQVVLLYLEEQDASAIGEITGLSTANVAKKIQRIKVVLARQFQVRQDHQGDRTHGSNRPARRVAIAALATESPEA